MQQLREFLRGKNSTISGPNAPFCDITSETCASTSGVLCGARAGNVRAFCERGSPTSQQVCTNSNNSNLKKNNLIFLDAIFARAQREPRARILRKQTHHRLNQDLRLLRAVSATMPADFWCVAAPKMQKNCKHFANFCAEKLRDLGAERDILRHRRLRRPKRTLK